MSTNMKSGKGSHPGEEGQLLRESGVWEIPKIDTTQDEWWKLLREEVSAGESRASDEVALQSSRLQRLPPELRLVRG